MKTHRIRSGPALATLLASSLAFPTTAPCAAPRTQASHVPPTSAGTPSRPQAAPDDLLDQGVLENPDEHSLNITGMMTDETVTKFGHDFFDAFIKAWRPLLGVSYNLHIGERYDPLRGSLIHVLMNNTPVYEGFLTPRQEAIEELASELARELRGSLKNRVPIEEELY